MVNFEELLKEVGSFGLYQRLLCFLLIPLTTGLCGLTYYTQLFLLTAPPHACLQDNISLSLHQMQYSIANKSAKDSSSCLQYQNDWTLNDLNVSLNNNSQLSIPTQDCTNGWVYDYSNMFPTYTSQNDLICSEAWRSYLVVTVFWVGNTLGSWLWGIISDSYGRRPVVAACLLVYGVAGLSSAAVENYYGFLFLRMLVGSAHHTISHLPFVLVMEFCGLSSRTVPLVTIMVSYTMASLLAPILAWCIWDWRTLTLITSAPTLLLLLAYRWLPESASWLITRDRGEAARAQLLTVAKTNGCSLPDHLLTQLLQESRTGGNHEATQSITKVLKYPNLRKNVLLMLFIWMLACMCYYGHCQNTGHLGDNLFVNYMLGAMVEVPSWAVPWVIHKLGRRLPLTFCFVLSGAASLIYAFIPQENTGVALTAALIGRLAITGGYYVTLQYCPELLPTVVRGQGVALSETLGGVAIFLSPSIVYLGEYHPAVPLAVFGTLSLLAATATLLLPETKGSVLPQTLRQAENLAARTSNMACCGKNHTNQDKQGDQDSEEKLSVRRISIPAS